MKSYFDLQLNGYAGIDFNKDDLTAEELHAACQHQEADGVGGFLGTIVSEQIEVMCRRLARLVELRTRDPLVRRLIAGIHIEGPFLNETDGFRGAHLRDAIRPANVEDMQQLLDAAGGLTRLVTLAPERDPGLKVTRLLSRQGIVVSAGHCDATLDQLRAAIDAGLMMFTHVGNGCPMMTHRHDNITQRALSLANQIWLCFIADGVHIPFMALGNYLRCATPQRCIVVTDAISAAGCGPGRFTIGQWSVQVDETLTVWAPDHSHLIGSAITMSKTEWNLREQLGFSEVVCRQLLWENPRRALGFNDSRSNQ